MRWPHFLDDDKCYQCWADQFDWDGFADAQDEFLEYARGNGYFWSDRHYSWVRWGN